MIHPYHLKQVLYNSLLSGSSKETELGSLYIKGDPGIGKSDIVRSVVEQYNDKYGEGQAQLVDVRLTICDPSDLRGMPFPDHENNLAKWLPPDILPTVESHSPKGILFFDDFTTAPPLVQAAAYQLFIQPHQLGNYQLPEGWIVVGAGNNTNTRSLANSMPKPLANRMIHINYEVDKGGEFLKHWVQWALEHNINQNVVGFLSSQVAFSGSTHLIYDFDPNKSGDAFATPRSWARVSAILERDFPRELERQLVTGTIGDAAASQFYQFVGFLNELPPVSIIINGENTSLKLDKTDHKYAMVVALSNSIENKEHMNNAIEWTSHQEMEFTVLLLRMIENNKEFKGMLMGLPALRKVGRAVREMTRRTESIKTYGSNGDDDVQEEEDLN